MIRKIFSREKGLIYFKLFIFLLVSVPTLSAFFLLLAIISSSVNRSDKYFEDKNNLPLFITGISLIIITLLQTLTSTSDILQDWSVLNSWLGLANWLPYFYIVWAIQPYLNNYKLRRNSAILLISGSMPLFFSIFGQYWFNWYGPFNLLNGFIVWFQRPIVYDHGATGLFNNQNYTAVWLLTLLPFSIALLREPKKNKLYRFIIFIITGLILTSLYLTKSRSGWIGSIIGSIFVSNNKFLLIFIPLILIFISLITLALIPISPWIQKYAILIVPNKILSRFKVIGFSELNYPRFKIWKKSIELITDKPLIGWGAATFPILYESSFKNSWRYHNHNIIFEIAQNYGIIPAIILIFVLMSVVIRSFKLIYLDKLNLKNRNSDLIFNRAWWSTSFLLLITQMVDLQYLDFRIGITFWLSLSGLICLIKENDVKKENQ